MKFTKEEIFMKRATKFSGEYILTEPSAMMAMQEFSTQESESLVKLINDLLEKIKALHPNLNMGDKKQEALYLSYHNVMFFVAEHYSKNNTPLTLDNPLK